MTTWKKNLEPYADLWADFISAADEMIAGEDDIGLRALLDSCKQPSQTNCWWATFQVAPEVAKLARSEIFKREAAAKPARREGQA